MGRIVTNGGTLPQDGCVACGGLVLAQTDESGTVAGMVLVGVCQSCGLHQAVSSLFNDPRIVMPMVDRVVVPV